MIQESCNQKMKREIEVEKKKNRDDVILLKFLNVALRTELWVRSPDEKSFLDIKCNLRG